MLTYKFLTRQHRGLHEGLNFGTMYKQVWLLKEFDMFFVTSLRPLAAGLLRYIKSAHVKL